MGQFFSFFNYLNTHDNNQGRCYSNSKCLLVGEVCAVLFHHDRKGSVGNKEDQERCAHPLKCVKEKLAFVEEKVLLAGFV